MAAVTTKKPGGDAAVQLTFPTVFEYTAAAEDIPMMMYGMTPPARHIPAASLDDVQEAYHEQKRADATRMALAAVQSRASSRNYYVKSHQGYIVPPPVLGQRIFANPSNGAAGLGGDLFPARRTAPVRSPYACTANGLHGGVLRTKEGQQWGATRLQDRVAQLNVIDAAEAAAEMGAFESQLPMPVAREVEQGLPSKEINLLVEFNTYRQALMDALISGQLDRFTITDFARMLAILFRVAPSANREELEDMKSGSDTMLQLMDGLAEQAREGYDIGRRGQHAPPIRRFIANITSLVEKTSNYINGMLGGVDKQPRERLALSKNLVRSLGFTKLLNTLEVRAPPTAAAAAAAAPPAGGDDDEDDDEGGDHFTRQAPTREDDRDEEAEDTARRSGMRRGFDRDQRQVFGTRSGAYEGEALAGDMPSSTAENAARRPRDNRMPVSAYASAAVRPQFSDVGAAAGYDDDWARSPPKLPRAAAAAAETTTPELLVSEVAPEAAAVAAAAADVRRPYDRLTPAAKIAAVKLAADSGLDITATRRVLGTSIATKTFDKARGARPREDAIAQALREFPQLRAPAAAAAAAPSADRVEVAPGEFMRRGLTVSIKGQRYTVGTPEFAAAYTEARKGKGRAPRGKMTPAIHAQQKLGRRRGGYRSKTHPDVQDVAIKPPTPPPVTGKKRKAGEIGKGRGRGRKALSLD